MYVSIFFVDQVFLICCILMLTCRYIQSTCATTGEGLYEGLDWLSNNIANKVLISFPCDITKLHTLVCKNIIV